MPLVPPSSGDLRSDADLTLLCLRARSISDVATTVLVAVDDVHTSPFAIIAEVVTDLPPSRACPFVGHDVVVVVAFSGSSGE